MDVTECNPSENLGEIKKVKKTALKDVNAYDEGDQESNYAGFEYFLKGKLDGETVATAAYRKPEGDVAKNLEINDSTAELKNIHVLPRYRRKGFASNLVERIENKARKEGYKKMVLRTTSIQEGAHKFYKSQGYEEIKRENPDYKDIDYNLVFFKKEI
jgi:GNAT superfamily N-acetyltransferase